MFGVHTHTVIMKGHNSERSIQGWGVCPSHALTDNEYNFVAYDYIGCSTLYQ